MTADRDYYDRIQAVNDQDSTPISFPGELPERRIPLTGGELLIGRRSDSRQHLAGHRPDRPAQGPRHPPPARQAHRGPRRHLDGRRPRHGERHHGQRPRRPLRRLRPPPPRRPHPPGRLDQDHHHPRLTGRRHDVSTSARHKACGPAAPPLPSSPPRSSFGREKRHSTPSRSSAAPQSPRMSWDLLTEQVPRVLVPVLAVGQHPPHPVHAPVTVRVEQPRAKSPG